MNPRRRARALASGVTAWDAPGACAATLGVTAGAGPCDAVLAAKRLTEPTVLPDRIVRADATWRVPADVEFYVDFETVNNLNDDFARLPAIGGQALLFQIGCGHWTDGLWQFAQWTTTRLTLQEEERILDAWPAHMHTIAAVRRLGLDEGSESGRYASERPILSSQALRRRFEPLEPTG